MNKDQTSGPGQEHDMEKEKTNEDFNKRKPDLRDLNQIKNPAEPGSAGERSKPGNPTSNSHKIASNSVAEGAGKSERTEDGEQRK